MFKVGDEVRVREDLIANESYNGCTFVIEMSDFKGKEYTIKRKAEARSGTRYRLEGEGVSDWNFSNDMLEIVDDKKKITKQAKEKNNNREELFKSITDDLFKVYEAKNADYGNSVGDTYAKLGDVSFLTRIMDKINRATTLVTKNEQKVNDEKLEDTIQDLVNYGILWLIEKNITQHTEE